MERYITERGDELRSISESEMDRLTEILGRAYPSVHSLSSETREASKQRMLEIEKDNRINHFGLFREGELVGAMRFYDFTQKILSIKTLVGGVGMVAVDMLHKKQKVAFNLIKFFLNYYHEKGSALVTLYPFRPDFYKQMGFGYGTKISRYSVKPASLPGHGQRKNVYFMGKGLEEEQLFLNCFNRYIDATNGLAEKTSAEMGAVFRSNDLTVAAYRAPGSTEIEGYVSFAFKNVHTENFVHNNIIVRELVYLSSEALLGLLAFLQSQADQINRVVFNMQDSFFHHVLLDPRNGTDVLIPPVSHESNLQGTGIMYRVIDTRRMFGLLADHDFGDQTLKLKLNIRDTFYPQNAGPLVIYFENGRATVQEDNAAFDVEVRLDIADFSSLLVGSVEFKNLYAYGLATLSDAAYIKAVNSTFRAEQPPICLSQF